MANIISLIDPNKEIVIKTKVISENYTDTEHIVELLNKKLKERYWTITAINI